MATRKLMVDCDCGIDDAQALMMWLQVAMATRKLMVDCDCGIDDAQALMMALAAPDVEVKAVTCVFGNADVDDVCQNVLRVLSVCQRHEVPVFRGSSGPLVGARPPAGDHFGSDGLGDVFQDKDPRWEEKIQKEHAVNAMIRLATEHPGQISLVALGPLTNLALAVRLDPDFPQKLKALYMMGGNMEGKGNVTLCGEFNFFMDPEAAYVVLEDFECTTFIATWEFACRNSLPWDFLEELYSQDSPAASFLRRATSCCPAYSRVAMATRRDVYFPPGFVSYDSYAMAAFVDGAVVTETLHCPVRVELQGMLGRGLMALDRTNTLNKRQKVFVLKTFDINKFRQLLTESVTPPAGSDRK